MVKKSFSEMQKELDEITNWFSEGYDDLDEAMAKYEQAKKLVAEMKSILKESENKIKKLNIDSK